MSSSTSMGQSLAIGGAIGGAGTIGFLGGLAAASGAVTTVICPPAGALLGIGIGIGTGLGALSKVIFGQTTNNFLF